MQARHVNQVEREGIAREMDRSGTTRDNGMGQPTYKEQDKHTKQHGDTAEEKMKTK